MVRLGPRPCGGKAKCGMSAAEALAVPADIAAATVIPLARAYPDVLALGAFLKNTVCVIRGDRAYVSEPLGDLDSPAAIGAFEANVDALLSETSAAPRRVAHDLHPEFHSTRFAETLGFPTLPVQHHHAHAAALMAEHRLEEPVLALTLDGFGLGPGNQAWGGELLSVDGAGYRRLGHLAHLPLPGGDAAAREPWRMAAAALLVLGRGEEISERFSKQPHAAMLAAILARGVRSPETSSCGRLFDAAAGLLGLRPVAEFEGQAPMELEALADAPEVMEGGWQIDTTGVLDTKPLLARLTEMNPVAGANLFHGTLAAAMVDWSRRAADASGIGKVVLGGGCFFNAVLSRELARGLAGAGLTAYFPDALSAGDPAISVGQALIAARTVEQEG